MLTAAGRRIALAALALALTLLPEQALGQKIAILFERGDVAEGAAAFQAACASGDSLTLESLWTDIRGLATPAELEEWKTRPSASRCALLENMLAERAMLAGLTVPGRLAVHYQRLARARADWGLRSKRVQAGAADSIGRHPDLMFDDRGFIYLRMGEPAEVAYAIAGDPTGPVSYTHLTLPTTLNAWGGGGGGGG